MEMENDLPLNKTDKLLKTFESIHNYIYANDGLSTQQTLEEIVKILFIKAVDEKEGRNLFRISEEEQNQISDPAVSANFMERLHALFEETTSSYGELFQKGDSIQLSSRSLAFVVFSLQDISLTASSSDAKGLAFQKFLSHHEKDGRGQFFTPEPVIDFCVRMIAPEEDETVIDPACGSGGFLFSAFQYVKASSDKFDAAGYISQKLYGLDINRSIARIAKMKLLLEALTATNIECINSLSELERLWESFGEADREGGFDVLLANPPFGTAGRITDKYILKNYHLGYKWQKNSADGFFKTSKIQGSQVAEILFIERCLDLLKEGGRMAIVLPNGHFENPSLGYVRHFINLKAKLLAVVGLPQETFIPYGTGVKTSLLFLEKSSVGKQVDYPVFFSQITRIGYQGNKNGTAIYKKDKYGKPIPIKEGGFQVDEDFTKVLQEYHDFRQGTYDGLGNSFTIPYRELESRLDYKYYAPVNRQLIKRISSARHFRLKDVVSIVKTKSKKLASSEALVSYVELADISPSSMEIANST